jgi:hypothetical protein
MSSIRKADSESPGLQSLGPSIGRVIVYEPRPRARRLVAGVLAARFRLAGDRA